jgi:hypothetical protein
LPLSCSWCCRYCCCHVAAATIVVALAAAAIARLRHGYGNTRGVLETGCAGTGTVCKTPTRGYTATHTRGITGMYGYKVKNIYFYYFIILHTT